METEKKLYKLLVLKTDISAQKGYDEELIGEIEAFTEGTVMLHDQNMMTIHDTEKRSHELGEYLIQLLGDEDILCVYELTNEFVKEPILKD